MTEYETWGNNEHHNPKLCEKCEYGTLKIMNTVEPIAWIGMD